MSRPVLPEPAGACTMKERPGSSAWRALLVRRHGRLRGIGSAAQRIGSSNSKRQLLLVGRWAARRHRQPSSSWRVVRLGARARTAPRPGTACRRSQVSQVCRIALGIDRRHTRAELLAQRGQGLPPRIELARPVVGAGPSRRREGRDARGDIGALGEPGERALPSRHAREGQAGGRHVARERVQRQLRLVRPRVEPALGTRPARSCSRATARRRPPAGRRGPAAGRGARRPTSTAASLPRRRGLRTAPAPVPAPATRAGAPPGAPAPVPGSAPGTPTLRRPRQRASAMPTLLRTCSASASWPRPASWSLLRSAPQSCGEPLRAACCRARARPALRAALRGPWRQGDARRRRGTGRRPGPGSDGRPPGRPRPDPARARRCPPGSRASLPDATARGSRLAAPGRAVAGLRPAAPRAAGWGRAFDRPRPRGSRTPPAGPLAAMPQSSAVQTRAPTRDRWRAHPPGAAARSAGGDWDARAAARPRRAARAPADDRTRARWTPARPSPGSAPPASRAGTGARAASRRTGCDGGSETRAGHGSGRGGTTRRAARARPRRSGTPRCPAGARRASRPRPAEIAGAAPRRSAAAAASRDSRARARSRRSRSSRSGQASRRLSSRAK